MKRLKNIILRFFSRGGIFHATKNYSNYRKKLDKESLEKLILNVGSGKYKYFKRSINVDPYRVNPGDIKARGEALPFKDNTFDIVFCTAVLEHVPQYEEIIKEIYRVLKKGGYVYVEMPFLQPLHAEEDYYRVTQKGLIEKFKNFKIIDVGVCVGPGSTVGWILSEYFPLFFSQKFLKKLIKYFILIIVSPLKYLDIFLIKNKEAQKIANGFYLYAQKI